jgi:predicted nuclease of predicted toxin-antitoxin system
MRFLVDANLSPLIAQRVREAGHEAVHVADLGLVSADDHVILERAADAGEVIITADADFGTLLALGGHARPSVVLLRSSDHLTPDDQATLLLQVLESVMDDLTGGAIASVTTGRVRIRNLPVAER